MESVRSVIVGVLPMILSFVLSEQEKQKSYSCVRFLPEACQRIVIFVVVVVDDDVIVAVVVVVVATFSAIHF